MKTMYTFIVIVALCIAASASATTWNVPGDFATIQDALDSALVLNGDRIMVEPGEYAGAIVTKAVEIKGTGHAVIIDGPVLVANHPAGDPDLNVGFFFQGGGAGSGATISHFIFTDVEFPVFSRGADSVTVTQCEMHTPIQGVSDWAGNGWEITHNKILNLRTANGGGIGILVADRSGGIVSGNVVAHNTINGMLHVWAADGGGYSGSGIVLYADFRWGQPGAYQIKQNRVVKNKIGLVSDNPDIVDVIAFELTDTRDVPDCSVIFDNTVGFNDFRGTTQQIVVTAPLESCNTLSRNLGDNRGHGEHPSLFGPGD